VKNNIQELRKQQKMTQEELADLCGVTRQTIISLESGRYNPSILLAHKIAQVFQSTIESVFNFDEEVL
jgi:putative transcriptional regulator